MLRVLGVSTLMLVTSCASYTAIPFDVPGDPYEIVDWVGRGQAVWQIVGARPCGPLQCAYGWVVASGGGPFSLSGIDPVPPTPLSLGPDSVALGVNALTPHTTIVGWKLDSAGANHLPVVWRNQDDVGPSVIALGTLGGVAGEARDVQDENRIVGWSLNAMAQRRATLWVGWPGEVQAIDLGTLGGDASEAYAINASGQVTGWAEDASGSRHAFIWTPNADGLSGAMRDVHNAAFVGSVGRDISNSGTVVGAFTAGRVPTRDGSVQLGDPADQPFVSHAGTPGDVLPTLGHRGSALSVNSDGLIVGWSGASAGDEPKAVLWQDQRLAVVQDRIHPTLTLRACVSVTELGVIACSGVGSTSPNTVFALEPKLPPMLRRSAPR